MNKIVPKYSLEDIQIAVSDNEFSKAFAIFSIGKIGSIEANSSDFTAQITGTEKYNVSVNTNNFELGDCNCYLGQKNYLCKHIIALAIAVVKKFKPEQSNLIAHPLDRAVCSGKVEEMKDAELDKVEEKIKDGLSYIKSYNGPSKVWFQYQDKLSKGSRIILLTLSELSICEKSVMVCIKLLKKLDKKLLSGGVDDSNGTIGGLMENIIELLCLFTSERREIGIFIAKNLPNGEVFDYESQYFTFNPELKKYRK